MTEIELVRQVQQKLKEAMYEIPDIAVVVTDSEADRLAKVYVSMKQARGLLTELEARYAD